VPSTFSPLLRQCADEIATAVADQHRRGYSGGRDTQYHLDISADEVAVRVLTGAGLQVISEESGVTGSGEYAVVLDPIDGSTNCDQGIPFYATSLAVMRGNELVASLVVNQATKTYYEAEAGAGATRDGALIAPSGCTAYGEAIVAFSGLPPRHLGWSQFRALGAASLEICLVADGSLDVFGVAQFSTLNTWDYLGGLLLINEVGAVAGDYLGEELVVAGMERRHPLFAATPELLQATLAFGQI